MLKQLLLFALTVVLALAAEDVHVDHYKALEVPKTATQKQVRSSYKKLSLKYHPDKHAGKPTQEEANKRFSEISAAYEVLGDEDKRLVDFPCFT